MSPWTVQITFSGIPVSLRFYQKTIPRGFEKGKNAEKIGPLTCCLGFCQIFECRVEGLVWPLGHLILNKTLKILVSLVYLLIIFTNKIIDSSLNAKHCLLYFENVWYFIWALVWIEKQKNRQKLTKSEREVTNITILVSNSARNN